MTDDDALLRAIYREPDEDTPRLAYADWLQEHDDEARAELIRVQCELAKYSYPLPEDRPFGLYADMVIREKQLLAAHAEHWRRAVCPRCEGRKVIEIAHATHKCPECKGAGDVGGLLQLQVPENEWDEIYVHRVEYIRGFPRVHVRGAAVWRSKPGSTCHNCKGLGQVSERRLTSDCVYCNGRGHTPDRWEPTPWAQAVCRYHADVEALWVTDREPNATEYGMAWHRDTSHHASTDGIPTPIFDLMKLHGVGDAYKTADTALAARTALARAAAAWVRGGTR